MGKPFQTWVCLGRKRVCVYKCMLYAYIYIHIIDIKGKKNMFFTKLAEVPLALARYWGDGEKLLS